MLRSTGLRLSLFMAFVSVLSLAALTRAGSINLGSVNVRSSGSGGSNGSKGKDASTAARKDERCNSQGCCEDIYRYRVVQSPTQTKRHQRQ